MVTYFPKPLNKQVAAISDSLSQTQDGLAIVSNGNTHAAISSGQFVYVKNHDTLAEGLYKSTTAIAQNGALSTSNLTADGSGGLNDLQGQATNLQGQITSLSSKITSSITKVVSGGTLDCTTLYKVGNTVYASGRVHSLDNVPTDQSFFNIPEGFRPKQTAFVAGFAYIKYQGATYLGLGLYAAVNPNGNVSINYSASATLSQIFFSGCWSVA